MSKPRPAAFRWYDAFWESGCPKDVGYTLLALWKFVANDSLRAHPSRATLAELVGATERSVERHINFAVLHGWAVRESIGHRGRNTEYRLAFGRRFCPDVKSCGCAERASSVTERATPVAGKGDTGVAPTTQRTTHRTTHTSSAGLTVTRRPLPEDWQPNRIHRSSALAKGVDVDELAETFTAWAVEGEETRKNWDAVFGDWINREAETPGLTTNLANA